MYNREQSKWNYILANEGLDVIQPRKPNRKEAEEQKKSGKRFRTTGGFADWGNVNLKPKPKK